MKLYKIYQKMSNEEYFIDTKSKYKKSSVITSAYLKYGYFQIEIANYFNPSLP